jgi:purine-binding chemotaxis protein CheW
MNALTSINGVRLPSSSEQSEQLVTFIVADQHFGIPALRVRDVLREQPLTQVPLAQAEIAGVMNLRGHIVPAINVRARLSVPPATPTAGKMCIVVEMGGDAFCLVVDVVGDVIAIKTSEIEPNPGSLQSSWAQLSRGLFRLGDKLLLLLDVDELLNY